MIYGIRDIRKNGNAFLELAKSILTVAFVSVVGQMQLQNQNSGISQFIQNK
jgi:hypothetical protein